MKYVMQALLIICFLAALIGGCNGYIGGCASQYYAEKLEYMNNPPIRGEYGSEIE